MQPFRSLLVAALIIGLCAPALAGRQETAPQRASADGRYASLLRVVPAPDDLTSYGEFNDWGMWTGTSYAGQENLPPGFWVYLHPNWYIWGEEVGAPRDRRSWGPEQATGAPDTFEAGDLPTAWASATPDGQTEWLELEYADAVVPAAVIVHETHNPGALRSITLFPAEGGEPVKLEVEGREPSGKAKRAVVVPVQADLTTRKVRIRLDSPGVSGWNEIDAVGLVDQHGMTHWAATARASSTYGVSAEVDPEEDSIERRLAALEAELRQLRRQLEQRRTRR